MLNILIVGIGGFIGASSRYFIGGLIQDVFFKYHLPFGTIAVNIIGCLIIGILAGISDTKELFSDSLRLLLFVGILGGFTTFSAFGLETLNLINKGLIFHAFGNVLISVVLALLAVWFGHSLGKII